VVGQVALQGARIGQNLVCYGGTFSNPPIKCIHSSGTAIDAGYAVIGGQAYLCSAPGNPFQVIGRVTLRGSRITQQLYWRGVVQPENASLDLTNASTDDFQDDEDSWRKLPSLTIDGFKYRTIDSTSYLPNPPDRSRTVALRLDWIRKQRPVKPQPYRQYAQALTESGDEDGATKVLIELEAMLKADHWLESAVLESTIGYGYAPLRSFWWLGGLTALGWIILRREGVAKSMVPSDKDAYALEKNNEPPAFQPRFVPFVYSLENSLPIVKLGQTDKWQIDSSLMKVEDSSGNWFWRFWRLLKLPAFRVQCFLWFQILAGWALATLFAAGVTGLVHSK
jgi:hypothetical protein